MPMKEKNRIASQSRNICARHQHIRAPPVSKLVAVLVQFLKESSQSHHTTPNTLLTSPSKQSENLTVRADTLYLVLRS
jgi:hypothetical protein